MHVDVVQSLNYARSERMCCASHMSTRKRNVSTQSVVGGIYFEVQVRYFYDVDAWDV